MGLGDGRAVVANCDGLTERGRAAGQRTRQRAEHVGNIALVREASAGEQRDREFGEVVLGHAGMRPALCRAAWLLVTKPVIGSRQGG